MKRITTFTKFRSINNIERMRIGGYLLLQKWIGAKHMINCLKLLQKPKNSTMKYKARQH